MFIQSSVFKFFYQQLHTSYIFSFFYPGGKFFLLEFNHSHGVLEDIDVLADDDNLVDADLLA
jgi:hypothetical protein